MSKQKKKPSKLETIKTVVEILAGIATIVKMLIEMIKG